MKKKTCRFCGATIEREGGLWVDALSGDDGGTYDICTGEKSLDDRHLPAVTS